MDSILPMNLLSMYCQDENEEKQKKYDNEYFSLTLVHLNGI